MQGSGVTAVEDTGQFFPCGVLTFHRRFKQGFLNIARHVAPNVHSRPSKQTREAFQSVSHWPSEMLSFRKEPRTGLGVPLPSLQKEVRMGLFTKDIKTMEDLLLHGLQDIYYAEQQIIKSLPKMIEKATNRDLVTGLKGHLEETNKQVERLQKAFEKLGKEPSGTSCPAIDGIIKEADETAGEIEDKTVLDAAIVANAQAVEHYEICRYGTLIAWAEELGHDEIVRFLTTNLNEEKAANTKLNTVALRKGVNAKASTAA
jgi:ferritin-like metal-binding protein YciE